MFKKGFITGLRTYIFPSGLHKFVLVYSTTTTTTTTSSSSSSSSSSTTTTTTTTTLTTTTTPTTPTFIYTIRKEERIQSFSKIVTYYSFMFSKTKNR